MMSDSELAAEQQPPVPDASIIEGATWNDEPVKARRVVVIVGEARQSGFWSQNLVGQERKAIEVKTRRERFFLDDDNGAGEAKVTSGDWREPYALLPVQRILS